MTGPARVLSLGAATLVLFCVLVLPNKISDLHPRTLAQFPLELLPLICALIALSGWPSLALRLVASVFLWVMVLLKLADMVAYESFSRPFNPVIDMFMLPASMNLLSGTLGPPLAIAAVCGVALALGVLFAMIFAATGAWSRLPRGRRGVRAAGIGALVLAGLLAAETGRSLGAWRLPVALPGDALTTRLAVRQAARSREAAIQLAAYRKSAATDPFAGRSGLFDLLDGRDVLVIFVESYGRTSFDNPLYRATHVSTLSGAEAALRDAGLAMGSGWLTSPIAGGQSWLAHGTLLSGLRTGDQARYGAMLASDRQTLFHLAARAGYRTAAVMPAITLPWPEGPMIGFETILAAADLDYAGAPFNWVTMPDQYTLATYPRLLDQDPRPDFIQIALISSHAPWVPVPRMVDWDAVGDGRIFDRWARAGDPPKVVWRDRDRVRDQYRQAIDYALQAAFAFVARRAVHDPANAPLVIVLGDHQPAPFVSQIESLDVPFHMIAPPGVLSLIEGWNLHAGLRPDATAPVWPMEAFRDRFIAATSSSVHAGEMP